MYNVSEIRKDFPVLSLMVNAHPNVFLDSAASAQKPLAVIEAMERVYCKEYANVHRGAYYLSEQITSAYEDARSKIVSLTDKAYREQSELEGLGDRMEESVTKNLTGDEKKEMIRLLHKLMGE